MAIDLGSGNTSRYYTVPDHDDLSLPNGDWTWLTLCYWPSGLSTANAYYIVSTGTVSTANSFNLFLGSGSNEPFIAVNTTPLLSATGIAPKDKWMYFYATRRSNLVYVGTCALGASSVIESPGQGLTAGSNGTGLHIGSRNDLNTARFWPGRIGQVAFVSGHGIAQADIVALANGAPLLSMPFAPQIKFLFHPRTASATVTDLIGGKVATRFGSSYGANEEDVLTPYVWVPAYIRGREPSNDVTGTVAYTNADDISVASASPTVTASSATTNADDVSVAVAAPVIVSESATTNANDVSNAIAAVGSAAEGSVAYTNIDDVSNAVAVPTVTGSVAATNADDSSEATATVTVTATVAVTNSNDVSVASTENLITATVAVTNADDISAAVASPVVDAVSATTNADDVSVAEAIAEAGEVIATVEVTNADDVSVAVAAPVIVGSVAYSNLHDFSAAIAVINFGTIIEAALTTGILQDTRIKKPGIPSDAPEWQRTMFEILTGRRGNKITVAPHQNLTFSATPTQAECEALYSYVSEVRQSIDQLTKRFDS